MSETRWVRVVALAPALAVASFGAVGLVLADAGAYHAWLVGLLGLGGWVLLGWAVRPVVRAPAAVDRTSHLAGAGAVVLAAGVGCWNSLHASQHVLTDRDPAIYNNTARWIARYGNLEFTRQIAPFGVSPFGIAAPGVLTVNGHADLQFQFPHFLPALLAEARGVGGDHLMFMLPAVLGAVAVFVFFVVGSRLLHDPFAALAATACFALLMPEVAFSRDSYSEIPMQVLFFTALWLLCDASVFRRRGALFAGGLCLGLLQAVRLDALSIVVGVPVVFVAAWILQGERRALFVSLLASAGGLGLGLAIGFVDVRNRSRPYLNDERTNVRELIAFTALVAVVSVAAALFAPRIGRLMQRMAAAPRRQFVANGAAVLAFLTGGAAWLVRSGASPLPKLAEPTTAFAAAALTLPAAPYSAHTVVWMAWYLGPVTIGLAIVAGALLLRSLVLHLRWEWFVAVVLLAPETALYLWRPRAHPDQLWVTRRLLVCAFPAAILLAFGLIVAIASRSRGVADYRVRAIGSAAAVALGAVAVVYPFATVVQVHSMTEQHEFVPVVNDACDLIGPQAALVIVSGATTTVSLTATVPIRAWCGVPAAHYFGTVDRAVLERAASQWKAQGRRLWIAAEDADTIRAIYPSVRPQVTRRAVNTHQLSRPLSHRPNGYLSETFQLAVAPVPAG